MTDRLGPYALGKVHQADRLDGLAQLPEGSVDAVVTDPPYGIGFMGKEWDTFRPDEVEKNKRRGYFHHAGGVVAPPSAAMAAARYDLSAEGARRFGDWMRYWALAAIGPMKPGGHCVVFGGTRTFHRLTCALEDAGFEIRDCLCWLFGSGFPKNLNVGKAIDKAAGAEREVLGVSPNWRESKRDREKFGSMEVRGANAGLLTGPATEAAKSWDGWGTALRPGWEPIILARKPLEGTVAANVQKYGTGALNIDGCRLPAGGHRHTRDGEASAERTYEDKGATDLAAKPGPRGGSDKGRWPANVALDDEAAAMLDEQSGPTTVTGVRRNPKRPRQLVANTPFTRSETGPEYPGDSGGPSRFYCCAKAGRQERNAGCEDLGEKPLNWSSGEQSPGTFQAEGTNRAARNFHPTVKPLDLMRWLVRLVTPPDGLVLDPFAGSGTTGCACAIEGLRFLGFDKEADYCEIANRRIAYWATHKDDTEAAARAGLTVEEYRAGQMSLLEE